MTHAPALSRSAADAAMLWRLRTVIFLQMLAIGIIMPFEGVWMKQVGLGETYIGTLGSSATAVGFAAGLLWGLIADRTGRPQHLLFCGYLALGGLWFYLAHCQTPVQFLAYAIGKGMLFSMTTQLMPLLVVPVLGPASGRGYAFYRIFGSLGFIVSTLLIPQIISDVRTLILLAAGAILFAPLPLIGFAGQRAAHPDRVSVWRVLHNRKLVAFLVATCFFYFSIPATFQFTAIYARELGASTRFIGVFTSINGFVALVGLPIVGLLVDRFGTRLLIVLAMIAQPLRVLTYSLAPDYPWLMVGQLFHIFTWAGLEIAGILFVTQTARPGNRATAMGMYHGAHVIGLFAGAFWSGYLAEHFGYPLMFRVCAAVSAVALLAFAAVLIVRNPVRPDLTDEPAAR